MSNGSPLPIDALVGHNVRIYRLQAGLTQKELGHRIGVSFQQIQKYETGVNRVAPGRLTQMADILGVPVQALFEGAQADAGEHSDHRALLTDPGALRLLQAFDTIKDAAIRSAILHLIECLGRASAGGKTTKKQR